MGLNNRSLRTYGLSAGMLLAAVALVGCEAPLMLDRVQESQRAAIHRTDMFQAATGNAQALVVAGGRGVIAVSNDGGLNWRREELAGRPYLIDADTCPDGSMVLLDVGRRIWRGDLMGKQWRAVPIDTEEAVQALACDPRGRLWVVGGFSSVLHSSDGGATWSTNSIGEDLYYTSVQFIDEYNGYLSGEFGALARTEDGGATWQPLTPLAGDFYPQDAFFLSHEIGWVVGLNGTVLGTEDGGNSWQRQETGTSKPLFTMVYHDGVLYVTGGSGTVLRSEVHRGDDGELVQGAWQRVDHGLPIRFYLRGAYPIDAHRLLVAGGFGALHMISG